MRQGAELLSNQLMEQTKFICIHKFYLHYKHHISSTNFLPFYCILFSLGFLNKFPSTFPPLLIYSLFILYKRRRKRRLMLFGRRHALVPRSTTSSIGISGRLPGQRLLMESRSSRMEASTFCRRDAKYSEIWTSER